MLNKIVQKYRRFWHSEVMFKEKENRNIRNIQDGILYEKNMIDFFLPHNFLVCRIGMLVLYSILDTRIYVRTLPPGFWNGLDWKDLIEACPPNIGKLRGWHFFLHFFSSILDIKKCFFEIFPDFFSGLGWTGELWSNHVFLILKNKEFFFHRIGPLGQFNLVVAMSVSLCVWCPFSCGRFWGLFCPHFPKSDVQNF